MSDVIDQAAKGVERLRGAKDQLRLEAKLAGMNARKRWTELQPTVRAAKKLAADIAGVSKQALVEIGQKVSEFRESLRRPGERQDATSESQAVPPRGRRRARNVTRTSTTPEPNSTGMHDEMHQG